MPRQSRPAPRELRLISKREVTPNMLRLTLGGPEMADFPPGQAGGYVKFTLPPAEGATKPTVRTYTIRRQHADAIEVDFALHGSSGNGAGPATEWALNAEPGDTILVGGPGPAKPLAEGADWYLVVGDMTALPAISVNLENLTDEARGVVVIEVQHDDDRQQLACPPGVELHWLVNPTPGSAPELLVERARALGWQGEQPYAWSASEFSAMRALRDYLRGERGLGPNQLYISSYWKQGLNEDSHKLTKREDALSAGM